MYCRKNGAAQRCGRQILVVLKGEIALTQRRKPRYIRQKQKSAQYNLAFKGACRCAVFFFLAIFWCEAAARSVIADSIFQAGLIYSALFALPAALVITLYTHLFLPRIGMLLAGATMIGIAAFYAVQIVSFERCGMLFTPGARLQPLMTLPAALKGCVPALAALLVPLAVWLILFSHHSFYHSSSRTAVAAVLGAIVLHLFCLLTTLAGGLGAGSPFSLYFKTSSPVQSAKTLGVGCTFRLETERSLFGFPEFGGEMRPAQTEQGSGESKKKPETKNDANLYNITDISFKELLTDLSGRIAALSEKTGEADTPEQLKECQKLLELDTFFHNRQPTKKNDHTGRYQDYNLIYITAESLFPYAIDEKRTPTLYKMQTKGYQFENFYTPTWDEATADGEFANLLSLYPEQGDDALSLTQASEHAFAFAPGTLLNEKKYSSYAYYGGNFDSDGRSKTYPSFGYTYRSAAEPSGDGEEEKQQTIVSDTELISSTASDYLDKKKFNVYYMTASGQAPYSFSKNSAAAKHEKTVSGLKLSEESKAYLASVVELDKALEQLLKQLEESGAAKRTIIAVVPDHVPEMDDEQLAELRGKQPKNALERAESCFLLYVPGQKSEKISTPCSNMDILPTLYNLMGVTYDSRLLMGTDVFSDTTPTVALQDGSWIARQVQYDAESGTAETYSKAEEGGGTVNDATRDTISSQIRQMQDISAELMEMDYFTHIGK